MILIEVKNGTVTKCISNNKDLKVAILDYDNPTEIPDYTELEPEYVGAKDMRIYIEDAVENKTEEEAELFPGTYDSLKTICEGYKKIN